MSTEYIRRCIDGVFWDIYSPSLYGLSGTDCVYLEMQSKGVATFIVLDCPVKYKEFPNMHAATKYVAKCLQEVMREQGG
jgi:hypothetical protein